MAFTATVADDGDGTDQSVCAGLLQPAVADQPAVVFEAVEAAAGFMEVVRRQAGAF